MGRLWRGMGGDPPPHRQHGLLCFSPDTAFPVHRPSVISSGANHAPTMVFTRHESRITAFTLFSLLTCKLWSGMGRLWRGMGGHRPPAPATRPAWFSRITAFFRITASLPTISHHFPAFPTISRPPPPPSAVLCRPHGARLQPPLPPPTGKHENGSPREHDSNVNL